LIARRVLLVDDSEVFRDGLRTLVRSQGNCCVCGEASDGSEAIQKTRHLRPDLVIIDFSMPYVSGIDAAREIQREFPQVPILLLTLFLTRQLAEDARRVGIRAVASKTRLDELLDGIQAALNGKEYLSPALQPTSA
jgi:two-component system, NarL family, nitrate/nitrite response regulator NarL